MGKPLRALMVEDVEQEALLAVRELRRGGFDVTFERVDTQEAMSVALAEQPWDVIISDYSMPRFSALLALGLMKERNLDLPFIIVSGTIGEDIAVEALRAGAHDFMVKGKFARLVPAVERELREAEARCERRRMEQALRASELRFQELFELAPDAIVMTTTEGLITLINRPAEALFGYSRDELIGQPVEMLIPQSSRNDHVGLREMYVRSAAPRAMSGGRSNLRGLRKDGTVFSVEISLGTVNSGAGLQVAAAVRDVTGRLLLEEQLRQSQKMEAVGRLAGGVAHDFNNVLSVILTYGELLLAELKPGEQMHDDVEQIKKAALRAADLTRQLLMFSRQQVLEPKILDLNDVLTNMDKMLQRILGADVDLVSLPMKTLWPVRIDTGSIEQVIMNLVVNARDAMPTGGKLTMETNNIVLDEAYASEHLGVTPGPHVMLAVTDTGTGIDKATLPRIFEPFFTTKEAGKGTGLGLSTVFGIAQQSGGSVWVYSEPGTGTTFKVYLPRVYAAVDAVRSSAPPTTLRGFETILLVEDDDQVRAAARGILRRTGYHVLEARNAGEALLHSEGHPGTIHLLLSDVVMPQMSGPELAKRLAKARPDMKVLCMSGYTDDSIVRHGVLDGHIAFFQKPITPAALTARVREVLQSPDDRKAGDA
jgi:PAS domain S-box-containing protein